MKKRHFNENSLDEEVVVTSRSEPQLVTNYLVPIKVSMDVTELTDLRDGSVENMKTTIISGVRICRS
jgi:hypothetical protein